MPRKIDLPSYDIFSVFWKSHNKIETAKEFGVYMKFGVATAGNIKTLDHEIREFHRVKRNH